MASGSGQGAGSAAVAAWRSLGRRLSRRPLRGPLSQRPEDDRRSVVLCTLLGADAAAAERVLARARRFPRVRVVVLTDGAAGPLLAAGIAVEHVPAPSEVRRRATLGAWSRYLDGRLATVRLKWQPALVVDEGMPFGGYLARCLADPDERTESGDGTLAAA